MRCCDFSSFHPKIILSEIFTHIFKSTKFQLEHFLYNIYTTFMHASIKLNDLKMRGNQKLK